MRNADAQTAPSLPLKLVIPPKRAGLDDRVDDAQDTAVAPSTPAGRRYAGDHKAHGETNVDNEALVEDINLDELPDSEGPDA